MRGSDMMIEGAMVSDIEEILSLQKLAYRSEAEIYNDFNIPPLVQTLEGIKNDFENQIFLKKYNVDNRFCQGICQRGNLLCGKTDRSS